MIETLSTTPLKPKEILLDKFSLDSVQDLEFSNMQAGPENTGDQERPRPAKMGKVPRLLLECIVSLLIAAVVIMIVVQMIPPVRDTGPQWFSSMSLHEIGIAMHDYHNHHKMFPPAVTYDPQGKPLYSWRVLLLPYLEEKSLYSQFKLDEPWDSPNNKPLLARIPPVYMPPSEHDPKEPFATHYLVFTGGGAMFEANPQARPLSLKQIVSADGTGKTLMVVEATEPVPWTKPEDLPYSPDQPLPKLGGLFSKKGFHVLTADGAVHWFTTDIDETTIRAMITWNGGEVVNLPD